MKKRVILGIAALAGAVGLVAVRPHVERLVARAYLHVDTMRDRIPDIEVFTEQARIQAREADKLAARWDELGRKTRRTAAENLEFYEVSLKLKEMFPQYAAAIDETSTSPEAFEAVLGELGGGKAGALVEVEAARKELKHWRQEWRRAQAVMDRAEAKRAATQKGKLREEAP